MNSIEILTITSAAGLLVVTGIGFVLSFRANRKLKAALLLATDATEAAVADTRKLESRLQDAVSGFSHIAVKLRELEEQVRLVSGAPVKSWTNINRRTQAVRMMKSGTTTDRIADELALSRGEVDLIRRVQKLTAEQCETADGPKLSLDRSNFAING